MAARLGKTGNSHGSGGWRDVITRLQLTRRHAVGLVIAVAAATALPLAAPQVTRRFIDNAGAGAAVGSLVVLAVAYLVLAVGGQVARVVTAWLAGQVAWDGTNKLREGLMAHALELDLNQHTSRTPGEMIERVDGDVTDVAEFIVAFFLEVVTSILLVIGVLGLVLLADLRIGAVLLAYLAVAGWGVVRLQRAVVSAMTAFRAASGALFGYLEERFAAIEEIRAIDAGNHVAARFQDVSRHRRDVDVQARQLSGRVLGVTFGVFGGAKALVLALAVVLFGTGSVTLGTAVLLLQYTQMLQRPVTRVIDHLEEYQKAVAGLGRVVAFLALEPRLPPPAGGGRPLPTGPSGDDRSGDDSGRTALRVEIDRVSFVYPGADAGEHPALHDVSLRVEPGRSLGLVGRTGSGKTTLARLLVRFYDPSSGQVRLDGIALREVAPASLRRAVVYVTQEVPLFTASVRDNLTLFRPEVPDPDLVGALDEVGMGAWLGSLPAGLDTMIGPSEVGLSAGEAQLLALARALLADPRVVVMDEASSRLDPATERLVEQAVDRLLVGRTAVVIAHRLSSLARVDDIAVLDRGRLVEYGARETLANDPGSRYGSLLALAGDAA